VITLRFITHAPKGIVHKIIAASGVGIAAIFGFALAGQMSTLIWPCSIILIVAALAGTPIFIVLGGFAVILFFNSGGTVTVIPNEAYTMLTSPIIPTIPLFTFAGFILSESKAGERLVHLFRAAFGWLPGGLAIMATIVCAFFTTFTGASGVTILALGGLLSFILIQNKYSKKFSTGLLTGSGSIGLLFPPSLPIILYGVVAHVNIKEMFVGGILPGTVMVLTVAILGIHNAVKNKVERTPFDARKTLSALKESIWEIALPFIIIVLFFKGITTLVETGAIAVLYVLIVEVFIHRDIKFKDFPGVLMKCIPMIGGVLMILAVARGLSYFIVDAEIPMQLAEWCKLHIHSKYIFLIALNLALLITGCFMDIFSAIMVVVPLIIPLGEAFGIHPVHLGIIFLANLELGYLTPPVGLNLFLASFRFNEPLTKIYRNVIPFLIALSVAVLLITYIPWLTTGLLGVFGFE
jgi:tripartite ATP-independent transporter DctM subunit